MAAGLEEKSDAGNSSPSSIQKYPSDSLLAHASSEGDSDNELFFSPPQSVSSASSSSASAPGIESSPNTERKESLDFLSAELRDLWKEEALRAFNERLDEIDQEGKIGKISKGDIEEALGLKSDLQTRQEMEALCANLWKRPWPGYEEADRTSIYPRIWELIEKNKRPEK